MTADAHDGETFLQRQKRLRAEAEALERGVELWAKGADAGGEVLDAGHPRARRWVEAKVAAQLAEVVARPEGDRNENLNNVAYSIGRLCPKWIDPKTVGPQLVEAAQRSGLPYDEALATVRSGMSSGMREPRDPPVSDEVVEGDAEQSLSTGEKPAGPTLHEQAVARYLADLRAREEARRLYEAEKAAREFRVPPSVLTLREQLLQPREATRFTIEKLLPFGGNVLVTAQYKTGKTTLMENLLKSYADAVPFLGKFVITPHAGRIVIFNYELSQAQFDAWLEEAQIARPERVSVLHLRGYRLPLTSSRVEDWIVGWLKEHDAAVWIADPFARAAVGTDENSNTEVGVWLDTFDVIKEKAGVAEGVLPVHTGRAEMEAGQERARGATRLDDWADARWFLTRNEHGDRFFRATGRDVEVGEEKLSYDEATRAYRFGGWDRIGEERKRLEDAVVAYVMAHPGESGTAIEKAVEGKAQSIRGALAGAVRGHRIRAEEGAKNGRYYYPQVLG